MSATVEIMRWNGVSPGTPTKITNINTRANAVDSNTTADTASPVQIPPTATGGVGGGPNNYSFWVSTRLQCTAAPATQIGNIKWYSGGSNNFVNGVGCVGNQATAYTQAAGTTGTGNQLTTANYPTLTTPLDVFINFPSSTPCAIAGGLPTPTTGDFGNWFVYQIIVPNTALPGATPTTTFTWKYDES